MKNFPKTTERFVAFFDLMGFKDLIYRNSHSDVCKTMDFVCDLVQDLKTWEEKSLREGGKYPITAGIVLPVIFSDSILFVSRTNSIDDARKIIYISSYFMCHVLFSNVPLKGAVSYGTFTADFEKSSFFGKPLIDSFFLSNETYFYGAVLHHTFEKYLSDKNENMPTEILKRMPLPMKSGKVVHSYIDWGFHLEDEEKTYLEVLDKFYFGVSGGIRAYVDNSKEIYI